MDRLILESSMFDEKLKASTNRVIKLCTKSTLIDFVLNLLFTPKSKPKMWPWEKC